MTALPAAARGPVEDRGPRPAVMVAVAVLLGAVLAGAWLLATSATRPAGAPAPTSRLEQLEAAVAADPDDLAARRALADLHFEADRFDLALEHYLVVLADRPAEAAALARSGWIAFEGGDSATAQRLVTESLAVRPDAPEPLWYLAQIRLYGLEDPEGAVLPLRRLLARDDLGRGFRKQVRELLAVARG